VSRLDAEKIKDLVLRYCMPGYYDFRATEFAPYHTDIRFDVIGIRRARRASRIVEVKSCRADFLSDQKWGKYLPYATHFYFAAPQGAIKHEELPREIGLIEVIKNPNGSMRIGYTKKCRKLPALSDEAYMKLIEGAFVRLKHELEVAQCSG
jgi:hypothetical protein